MSSFSFSSVSLPDHLDHQQRFKLWRDIFTSQMGNFDLAVSENLPFSAEMDVSSVGPLAIIQMNSTLEKVVRTANWVASDGRDEYHILINQGATLNGTAARREVDVPDGSAILMSSSYPGAIARPATGASNVWMDVTVPGHLLRAAVANPDDLVARAMPAGAEALRLLTGYADLLRRQGAIASPALLTHATNTLVDLIALTLGAAGENSELAGSRGLRSARLQAILGQIQRRFTEVGFSTGDVAAALGISARYVNDVLSETGMNFSDRVLEFRLQRARTLLADRRNDGMRVGDIAYAAGFADISHFNRSFRRRFGMTPSGAR